MRTYLECSDKSAVRRLRELSELAKDESLWDAA